MQPPSISRGRLWPPSFCNRHHLHHHHHHQVSLPSLSPSSPPPYSFFFLYFFTIILLNNGVSPLFTRLDRFQPKPKWLGWVWPNHIERKEDLLGWCWPNSFRLTSAQFLLGRSQPRHDGLYLYNWVKPILLLLLL